MDYMEVTFTVSPPQPATEILIAQLAEIDFDSFVDTDSGVLAYVPQNFFSDDKVRSIIKTLDATAEINYSFKLIETENWNATWEKSFSPIVIDGVCAIRAPFHILEKPVKYDILIEPKMSFGTGHHETTALMLQKLIDTDVTKKSVLDMGCGTAVLAILAAKLGAEKVTAIDIDDWAYHNSIENTTKNNTSYINVIQGDCSVIANDREEFDLILANINKNVLLADMPGYIQSLKTKGGLIISGFFNVDIPDLNKMAESMNLSLKDQREKNSWAMLHYIKN